MFSQQSRAVYNQERVYDGAYTVSSSWCIGNTLHLNSSQNLVKLPLQFQSVLNLSAKQCFARAYLVRVGLSRYITHNVNRTIKPRTVFAVESFKKICRVNNSYGHRNESDNEISANWFDKFCYSSTTITSKLCLFIFVYLIKVS